MPENFSTNLLMALSKSIGIIALFLYSKGYNISIFWGVSFVFWSVSTVGIFL